MYLPFPLPKGKQANPAAIASARILTKRNRATQRIITPENCRSSKAIAVASNTPKPPGAPGTINPNNQAKLKALSNRGI